MAGRERPGSPLAVHAQRGGQAVHRVGLDLGQVVRDVVDEVDVPARRLREDVPHHAGEHLPVGAAVVGGRRHRPQVIPPLRRGDGRARQLAVGHGDAVAAHHLLHGPDVVAADLVAQAAGAAVDHDADLPVPQPEPPRRVSVVDQVHGLDLQEVVARAEAADLVQAAVHRPAAHLGGVGVRHRPLVLTPQQVALVAVALRDRVARPARQHVPQLPGAGQPPDAAPPRAARGSGCQSVHQPPEYRRELGTVQIGREQPHPARDVEADAAR